MSNKRDDNGFTCRDFIKTSALLGGTALLAGCAKKIEQFKGILCCDGFLAYDAIGYRQQKCLGHILRRCKEIEGIKSGRAVMFSGKVAYLLMGAIKLKERYKEGKISGHG